MIACMIDFHPNAGPDLLTTHQYQPDLTGEMKKLYSTSATHKMAHNFTMECARRAFLVTPPIAEVEECYCICRLYLGEN